MTADRTTAAAVLLTGLLAVAGCGADICEEAAEICADQQEVAAPDDKESGPPHVPSSPWARHWAMHFDSYVSGSFTSQLSWSMMHSDAHSSTPEQSSEACASSNPQMVAASSHTVPHPASIDASVVASAIIHHARVWLLGLTGGER